MQKIKLDPVAYFLILGVLGMQIYSTFLRPGDVDSLLEENERAYQAAVFSDEENKGVMHQVFRQNEVDRQLLRELVARCGR
jgi:hypothetical protein